MSHLGTMEHQGDLQEIPDKSSEIELTNYRGMPEESPAEIRGTRGETLIKLVKKS